MGILAHSWQRHKPEEGTQFTDQTPLNSPNIKATRRMQQIEMADYVNERPRREQKRRGDTTQTGRRLCHLLFLGFGVLFIIQAILNISLRLTLYSSKESTQSNSNATDFCNQNQMKEEENYCERKKPGEHNRCQERINALTRDKNLLENRNTELTNMIKNVEEERDRLKSELKELRGCSSSQQCPAGWTLINCRCYFVSTEVKTWKDSREYCQSKDADLVVINSEEEQKSLYRLKGKSGCTHWIGLYVPTGSTGWKWVDGSALTKSFWTPGQSSRHPVIIEDCVTMCFSYPELANWHDYPCSSKQRWLCEKAPRPCL
ncbi:CD209 antigen-like protein C [Sebastes umbrosus]|uniref:CD209 antigen-like protein C n=1 Tax=Sebastes umbrosus TaxID=72105 RepID=UPI0018A06B29|nr:CD209 antigen-like protein C [Sebastes umbrosus]